MSDRMRAWLLDDFIGLGALRLSDAAPRPQPGPLEVLIRIDYAALNPADRFLAENLYPAKPRLPHILGRDGSGVVEQVGPGASRFRLGDKVAVLRSEAGVERPGTFAEYLAIHEDYVVPAPAGWTDHEAGAAPLVYLTAHQALTQWGRATGPETVLITGVSGGVGIATVHLAKAMGHRVIGLSRGERKRQRLAALGTDLVLDPADRDLKAKVKEFTARKGVDLVVDNVGGELFNVLLDMMAYRGRISVVGSLGGNVPSFNPAKLLFRRTRVGGVLVFDYQRDEARGIWNEVLSLMQRTGARPVIDSVFPFEQLKEAFAKLASGPMGKVLLDVRGRE
jgi:NADPH2:quinone reductase